MNRLFNKPQRWLLLTGVAILLHWGVLLLFTLEIIPQTTKNEQYTFLFHHGGDEYGYWLQVEALERGAFQANKYPLGFPILLVPLQALINATDARGLVEPAALFWSVLMFPVMQLLLAWFARQITARDDVAWLSAVFVGLFPLLAWSGFNLIWNAEMAEIIAIHMTWAQMLSDGPAAFFSVLALALYWCIRQRDYPLSTVLILGSVLGLLAMIRYSAGLIAVVIGVAFLVDGRWREATLLVVASIVTFLPQALYNLRFFDSMLTTGYTVLDNLPQEGLFDLRYLLDALAKIWERLGVLTIGLALPALGFAAWGLALIWQRTRIGFWLIAGWVVSYLIFYSVYYYSWTGALMRFLIPIMPACALILAATVAQSADALRSIDSRSRQRA